MSTIKDDTHHCPDCTRVHVNGATFTLRSVIMKSAVKYVVNSRETSLKKVIFVLNIATEPLSSYEIAQKAEVSIKKARSAIDLLHEWGFIAAFRIMRRWLYVMTEEGAKELKDAARELQVFVQE